MERVLDAIIEKFSLYPEKTALHWLGEECNVVDSYTYADLDRRTKEIARGLIDVAQKNKKQPQRGQRAVMYYNTGLDFILNFLGCLRAGVIPVTVKSPNTLLETIKDCEASFVLTNKEFKEDSSLINLVQLSSVPWYYEGGIQELEMDDVTGEPTVTARSVAGKPTTTAKLVPERRTATIKSVPAGEDYDAQLDLTHPQDIAFLQYTSGTDGKLKGVIVSFRNMLHNLEIMTKCFKTDSSTIEVGFFPHSNSFSLVGSYLHTIFSGASGYYMSSGTFFDNPGKWIKAMHLYKATHTKVPNFTFDYLTMRTDLPVNLNLNSVKCITCLEPVCIEEITKFEGFMASYNLKENLVRVGYGLVEHVAIVSSMSIGDEKKVVNGIMSCGQPHSDVLVKIVNTTSLKEVDEDEIGEVWVSSDSKSRGYWNRKEMSEEIFQKNLEGIEDVTFLRTGELGFMRDNYLYICERISDVIHINKKDYYPANIEDVAKIIAPTINPRKVVCFLNDDPDKSITIVAELRYPKTHSINRLNTYCNEIQTQVHVEYGLIVSAIIFTNPFVLPFNLSGKPQRLVCKEKFLKKRIPIVFEWPSSSHLTSDSPMFSPAHSIVDKERKRILKLNPAVHSSMPFCEPSKFETTPKNPSSALSSPTVLKLAVSDSVSRRGSVPSPVSTIVTSAEEENRTMSEGSVPRRDNVQVVATMVSSVLKRSIYPDTDIWEGGISDQQVKKLSRTFSKELGFAVNPDDLYDKKTPRDLTDMIKMSLLTGSTNISKIPRPSVTKDPQSLVQEAAMVLHPLEQEAAMVAHPSVIKASMFLHPSVQEAVNVLPPSTAKVPRPSALFPSPAYAPHVGTLKAVYESTCDISLSTLQEASHFQTDIAIIGMAGSFPGCDGCDGLHELWNLMERNRSALTSQYDTSTRKILHGGFSLDVGKLDYKWFRFNHEESYTVDPHEAMLLYTTHECLLSAGYSAEKGPVDCGDWGVFMGLSKGYEGGGSYRNTSNLIAKAFSFRGPVMNVDTVSASCLTALDVACMNIKRGKCDAALVGGVNTLLTTSDFTTSPLEMMAPDKKCMVFDESADGYVLGEGCGAVLLMTVGKALKYGRRIYGIIKGIACSNNGGIDDLTPEIMLHSQTSLISSLLDVAGISPQDVSYIEANAKGTEDDEVEMKVIEKMFTSPAGESKDGPKVVVGSVKANIGHLEGASGIAGILKALMVLEHSEAPGNVFLDTIKKKYGNKKEVSYPKHLVDLPCLQKGHLHHAIVNTFDLTGMYASILLQQYSYLPHMAGTESWLLFGTGTSELCCKDIVASLESYFPIIRNAFNYFDKIHEVVCEEQKFKRQSIKDTQTQVLRVYYGLAAQLQTLRVKLSSVGGSDAVGEVMALLLAGSIDLYTAIQMVNVHVRPDADLSKKMKAPIIPVYSYLKKKILTKDTVFTKESSTMRYIVCLIARIKEPASIIQAQLIPISLSKKESTPVLYITPNEVEDPDCISLSLQELGTKKAIQYMRKKYLKLREASDVYRIDKDSNMPTKTDKDILGYFERLYPLRKTLSTVEDEVVFV